MAPRHPGCSYQIVWGKLACPYHPKSCFIGTYRHTQKEGDVFGNSICGKDSGLHTKHRLRFLDEPISSPQFTECIRKMSQMEPK